MEDYSLFSRDTEVVTAELNKTKWLPFIGKEKVLRLITSLTNRWAELYRVKRIEDNKNVLSRLQELDRNYQEREEFRMQLLVKTLEEYKKSFIKKSECAFCMAVCKEIATSRNNGALCSCGRRSRYIKQLEESIGSLMEEKTESLIKEYQEGPKWEERTEQ